MPGGLFVVQLFVSTSGLQARHIIKDILYGFRGKLVVFFHLLTTPPACGTAVLRLRTSGWPATSS